MSEGYNWRNTLSDFASVSGILAGFCVTFIGIILGWDLANVKIYKDITFGNISVSFFGVSAVLFISASELLLHSKTFDIFGCPKDYREWLEKGMPEIDWEEMYKENNEKMQTYYNLGKLCYNCAIFMLYAGLFLAITPYNVYVALSVFFLGVILQFLQFGKEFLSKFFTVKGKIKYATITLVLVLVLLISCITCLVIGFGLGRQAAIDKITHFRDVSINLSSIVIQSELKQLFPRKMNYTELLRWESGKLSYTTEEIERHTNPIEILNYGLGRCGEFSILYVAICLANGIPARLVTDLVVDHVWAEVNPSGDGITWIHVEPTDSCVRIQNGRSIYDYPATVNNPHLYRSKNLQMVLAFQITGKGIVTIIDRTMFYKS